MSHFPSMITGDGGPLRIYIKTWSEAQIGMGTQTARGTSMPETVCSPSKRNTQPTPSLILHCFSILSCLLLLLPLSLAAFSSVPKCALQCQLCAWENTILNYASCSSAATAFLFLQNLPSTLDVSDFRRLGDQTWGAAEAQRPYLSLSFPVAHAQDCLR